MKMIENGELYKPILIGVYKIHMKKYIASFFYSWINNGNPSKFFNHIYFCY